MSSSQSDLSEYEKIRLENIRRNAAFLSQLGFDATAKREEVRRDDEAPKKHERKPKRKVEEVAPTRYSQRLRSMEAEEASREEANAVAKTAAPTTAESTSSGIDYSEYPETSEELDDHEFQVYVFLRAWRLKTSRELDIEPYKVCQNRTLAELVRRRRNDPKWARRHGRVAADLLECWGIGPSKARPDGFGAQMVELLDGSEEMEEHLLASREGKANVPEDSVSAHEAPAENKESEEKK